MLFYDSLGWAVAKKLDWEHKGYSVSMCPIAKAKYLSEHGSLFLYHVTNEGRVVSGDAETLNGIRSKWQPARDYQDEVDSNKQLLSTLAYAPNNIYGHCISNDILICSIRNVLIRRLASNGCYVFAWPDILRGGINQGLLNSRDVPALLLARRMKNMYRSGRFPNVGIPLLNHLVGVSQTLIDRSVNIRLVSSQGRLTIADRYRDGSYSQLRGIELLCAHYDFHSSVGSLRSATKDPSYFSAVGPNNAIH